MEDVLQDMLLVSALHFKYFADDIDVVILKTMLVTRYLLINIMFTIRYLPVNTVFTIRYLQVSCAL